MDVGELKARFEAMFGRPAAGAVRAPGRVNLIGEHTDYNDGFVMPIAIERQTIALYAPRRDRTLQFRSLQAQDSAAVDLDKPISPGEPSWANYCKGVAAGLIDSGIDLVGADVLLASDLPAGGGLSSSAALEVATAFGLLAGAGAIGTIPDRRLALICQTAEHEFAGAPCGIMDQSIAIMGQAGRALLLDCRSGQMRQIPFDDPRAVVLIADTQVKHDIAAGSYAARRERCSEAARTLGVSSLRDVGEGMLDRLDGVHLKRARHVVGEIQRTLEAAAALELADYDEFGRLMYASHASLRDDYEVSCEELDTVVQLARQCQGVYGARMTGGGFGGCAVILAATAAAEQITRHITAGFAEKFGRECPVFATRAASGASVLD